VLKYLAVFRLVVTSDVKTVSIAELKNSPPIRCMSFLSSKALSRYFALPSQKEAAIRLRTAYHMLMSVLRAGCMFPRTHASTNSFFLSPNELMVLSSDNIKMQAFNTDRAVILCCRILVNVTTNTQRLSSFDAICNVRLQSLLSALGGMPAEYLHFSIHFDCLDFIHQAIVSIPGRKSGLLVFTLFWYKVIRKYLCT
jgi:hypothetical protein